MGDLKGDPKLENYPQPESARRYHDPFNLIVIAKHPAVLATLDFLGPPPSGLAPSQDPKLLEFGWIRIWGHWVSA